MSRNWTRWFLGLRCLSEASIPPIAFCCSSRKISTPNWRTEVAPARHAKAAERPHACAPPSIAGQVPARLPAKPGLGKTWTSQAHLPQAHQQQLSSQNYRSCSGSWTLRLSQFCVQGNRVRLKSTIVHQPIELGGTKAVPERLPPKSFAFLDGFTAGFVMSFSAIVPPVTASSRVAATASGHAVTGDERARPRRANSSVEELDEMFLAMPGQGLLSRSRRAQYQI